MTGLSKKFRAAVLGLALVGGIVGCSKPPAQNAQAPTVQPLAAAPAPQRAEDPAVTPLDPALRGFWLSYSEVDKRADLNYDRNLQGTDGKPVYSVTLNYPMATIPDANPHDLQSMKVRNKVLLDFMAVCMGAENTKAITQMSEGVIVVYTTPVKMRNTIEITHVTPGQKGYTTDAVLGCADRESPDKINAAVAKLKADNGHNP